MSLIKKTLVIFINYKISKDDVLFEIEEFKKLIFSFNFCIDNFIKINIKKPNRKYFINSGKLLELKIIIDKNNYFFLLINLSLKSSQENNLKNFLNCNILNKTNLLLYLFKKRANTIFGKLQVKLATLLYLSTRLVKQWSHLERQRGGVKYISGPGEKQIEIDRRLIKKEIRNLKIKLFKLTQQRMKSNKLRIKNNLPLISLIGYTNSGKSTLFNLFTKSDFLVKNVFFSTLDTYIKKVKIFNLKNKILISDTIGFIKNLPNNIMEAFKATLDEIRNSKLILHIIDISDIYFQEHINSVNLILSNMNISNIPIIQIMNKIDCIRDGSSRVEFDNNNFPYRIWISAKYHNGIYNLCKIIDRIVFLKKKKYKLLIPFKEYMLVCNFFYRFNYILSEFSNDGLFYSLLICVNNTELLNIIKKFSFLKKYIK